MSIAVWHKAFSPFPLLFPPVTQPEIFLFPIIGWSMFLTGHILLKRTDKRSQMAVLTRCGEVLAAGAPVLFFPEGTRSLDGCLGEFKKGAFSVAVKAKVWRGAYRFPECNFSVQLLAI